MADDEISEDELETKANFKASISDKTMYELERAAQSKGVGQGRRLALAAVARDAETLTKLCKASPEAFGEMREMIECFREHAQGLLKLAESASIRMAICDVRYK